MWDKDDPKSKWLHLAVKLIAAAIIFHVGVMVGEFKIIKTMVIRGGTHQKMLFSGDEGPGAGARFFTKRIMPGEKENMMFWKGDGPAQPAAPAPQP